MGLRWVDQGNKIFDNTDGTAYPHSRRWKALNEFVHSDAGEMDMTIPATCYTIAGNYAFINAPGCAPVLREMLDLRAGIAAGLPASSIICHIMVITNSNILGFPIVRLVYKSKAEPKSKSATSIRPRSMSRH